MKTVVTDVQSWKKRIEVEVDYQEVRPYLDKAIRKYQKKISLDGFRKGKVPLSIIKKRFGDAIQAEISEELIQIFFKKAVEKEDLAIVAPGSVEDVTFEENLPFRFVVEVEVEPEITVSSYKGFKVEKPYRKVTQDDVKQTIHTLREQKAESKPVDGEAREGHIIEGDIQAVDASGVPIIGRKWENRVFEMGVPPLGDILQDQLMGVVAGEERRFKIPRTEKDSDGKEQMREDHYSISVHAIKEKILPELDDEFAKSMGEFDTLLALEENVRQRLEAQQEDQAEKILKNRIADEIIKRNDFELPPIMVENGLNRLWEDYKKRPESKMDEKHFRDENRPAIVWNLKWHLIWRKIAELEEIAVTDSEVNDEIEKMATAPSQDEKKIRAWFRDQERRKRLKENLLEDKLMDFLKENVKIKEVILKDSRQKKSSIIT